MNASRTTPEQRAMIRALRRDAPRTVLGRRDIEPNYGGFNREPRYNHRADEAEALAARRKK